MMMKKRATAFLVLLSLFLSLLSGCGQSAPEKAEGKLSVVVTVFPVYDWISNILGETGNTELTLLLDKGVDLHSYQPSVDDIIRISTCDVFIYVGGSSDDWVEDALKEARNQKMIVLNLLDALGDLAREEELVEGMEAEEEDEGVEYDEHVWLSLRNASILCRRIAEALETADGQNAASYEANLQSYLDKLEALDAEYQAAVDSASYKTLLFGDRFPFRYLTEDYGLSYYAAFLGCSAETEASFETVVFLSNKLDELGLPAIMQIESSDGSMARTIRDSTVNKDQKILTLDSMQSGTSRDTAEGVTYLKVMEQNLAVLKEALQP